MNFETIEFAIDDGVARLTLNRPDKLNSFNAQMHQEVREVIKTVHKDDGIRCLLLGANGRGFCAGQDLSERNVAPDAEVPDPYYGGDDGFAEVFEICAAGCRGLLAELRARHGF